jgi:peptidoglycan hydrolase-like protein with peptidoglycan-binding domain
MALTFDDLEPGNFQPTSVDGGLPKLVRIWEHLRDLNTGGYGGAVLVDVKDAISKGSKGVTSCSPFTGTCIYMALDPRPFNAAQPWSLKEPYEPVFDGGKPLDVNFYRLHNGFSLSSYASVKDKKFAGWKADFKKRYVERIPQLASDFSAFNFINHSAGSVVALNLGKRVDSKQMRRGDMVGIDWHNGNGHATFCWNVHLNKNGEVDCFQFISSNGTSANGGAGITIFRYPDVDPAYLEKSGGKYKKKREMFSGIVDDPHAYPEYIQKPYWWFGLPGVKKGDLDLGTFGVPAKTIQISYADSMDVSVHQVHVARLHGVVPPEPYLRADGGKTPEPRESANPAPLAKAKAKKADEGAARGGQAKTEAVKAPPGQPHPVQEELEGHLQTLWKTRWISKDPGDPSSVNDPESQAAIRDYQERYMKGDVPKLGHADPKTRARIAKAAASATAMPMVNAALHLAFERGEIHSAPGTDPMRLDDATRAALKEFQKKKGLDADGIPGHETQEKLSAYMKEAARSQPAQDASRRPAAEGDAPPAIRRFYFTRNHGPCGTTVRLKATATPACEGKSYPVALFHGGTVLVKDAGRISIEQGGGTLDISIPDGIAAKSSIVAKLSGVGVTAETVSPFQVLEPLSSLPLILAGPIVRRADAGRVWFWFACREEVTDCTPALFQYDHKGERKTAIPLSEPERRTVRLGKRLWITLVSARPKQGNFPPDTVIGYDLAITYESGSSSVRVNFSQKKLGINYPPFDLPTFLIRGADGPLVHGSCRRPGANGVDAFGALDRRLQAVHASAARPAALFLTGDQIYADDVAHSLFVAVRKLSIDVMGFDERLPMGFGHADQILYTKPDQAKDPPKGTRRRAVLDAGFTTDDGEGHLLTFGEFAAMYLLVWNPELCQSYGLEKDLAAEGWGGDPNLKNFTAAVQQARRVLANVATYMIFDDHEITDDWNISEEWIKLTENAFAKRVIANGLAAYWAFQGWGNLPEDTQVRALVEPHLEALRDRDGKPYPRDGDFTRGMTEQHSWSYVAPTRPPVLVTDERTSRQFGRTSGWIQDMRPEGSLAQQDNRGIATLIGDSELKRLGELSRNFKRGQPLVVVLATPILAWVPLIRARGMKMLQDGMSLDRLGIELGDLWADVPLGAAEFFAWVKTTFDPSYCAVFSGDVHHGYVVKATCRGGDGRPPASAQGSPTGSDNPKWQFGVIQITSSACKNENPQLMPNAKTLERTFPTEGTSWQPLNEGGTIRLDSKALHLTGDLGIATVIPNNHFCVVDFRDPKRLSIDYFGEGTAGLKVDL